MGVVSRSNYRLAVFAARLVALMVLYVIIANWLPFAPFQINYYTAMPERGCPGTAIQLNVNTTRIKPPLGALGAYTLRTNWESADGALETPIETFSGDFGDEPYGTYTAPSRVLRTSPNEPGVWHLKTDVTYEGRLLGWPRSGAERYKSAQLYESLPADAEECLP